MGRLINLLVAGAINSGCEYRTAVKYLWP